MFTLKQLIVLALAGTAVAAPFARRGDGDSEGPRGRWRGNQGYKHVVTDIDVTPVDTSSDNVVTVYTVPNNYKGKGRPNKDESNTGSDDTPTTGDDTPTTGSDTPASSGSDTGYMATVNKYRAAGGLAALKQSSKLEANALKTAKDGNGQMRHQLNSGSMGQVLAPGSFAKFESIYVGGWLCEMPGLKGLNGACSKMTAGWDHSNGDTGHAKILTSTSYTHIGCGSDSRIMACDLGNS